MNIIRDEAMEVLNACSDLVIRNQKLRGKELDAFMNGVHLMQYAFRRGLGRKDDIQKQFDHIKTFESVELALGAICELEALLLK